MKEFVGARNGNVHARCMPLFLFSFKKNKKIEKTISCFLDLSVSHCGKLKKETLRH